MRKLVYQPREEEGKAENRRVRRSPRKSSVFFQSYNEYIVIQEKPEIIIHTDKLRRAQHIERSKAEQHRHYYRRIVNKVNSSR